MTFVTLQQDIDTAFCLFLFYYTLSVLLNLRLWDQILWFFENESFSADPRQLIRGCCFFSFFIESFFNTTLHRCITDRNRKHWQNFFWNIVVAGAVLSFQLVRQTVWATFRADRRDEVRQAADSSSSPLQPHMARVLARLPQFEGSYLHY